MAFRLLSRVPMNESWVTEVFGRHFQVLRPGSFYLVGRVRERVPTSNQLLDVSVPAAASKDGLLTNLSASISFKVEDPKKFSYQHSRPIEFLKEVVENALRSAVATVPSTSACKSSSKIANHFKPAPLDNSTGEVDSGTEQSADSAAQPATVADVVNALLSDRGDQSLHNLVKACGISIVGVDIKSHELHPSAAKLTSRLAEAERRLRELEQSAQLRTPMVEAVKTSAAVELERVRSVAAEINQLTQQLNHVGPDAVAALLALRGLDAARPSTGNLPTYNRSLASASALPTTNTLPTYFSQLPHVPAPAGQSALSYFSSAAASGAGISTLPPQYVKPNSDSDDSKAKSKKFTEDLIKWTVMFVVAIWLFRNTKFSASVTTIKDSDAASKAQKDRKDRPSDESN